MLQTPLFLFSLLSLASLKMTSSEDNSLGTCYSPFHLKEYPLNGGGSASGLPEAITEDLKMIRKYQTSIRTYYSSFIGTAITPLAASAGLDIYLGVYMTSESWYQEQEDAAVEAVAKYPNTIKAIFVSLYA